jgi:hypothetical protein
VVKEDNPVIHGIAESFRKLKVKFLCENKNFWSSNLCFNPLFTSNTNTLILNEVWFRRNLNITIAEACIIKISHIAKGWDLRRLDEIIQLTGLQWNLISYMRLAEEGLQ